MNADPLAALLSSARIGSDAVVVVIPSALKDLTWLLREMQSQNKIQENEGKIGMLFALFRDLERKPSWWEHQRTLVCNEEGLLLKPILSAFAAP